MANGTFLRVRRARGAPIVVGARQVTPIAWTVHAQVSWRGRAGLGLAWGRPLAVEVVEGGRTRRLAVPDAQLRFNLVLGLAGLLLARLARIGKR